MVKNLREHANRVTGDFVGEKSYDPETLSLKHEAADMTEVLNGSLFGRSRK